MVHGRGQGLRGQPENVQQPSVVGGALEARP
jgi:hypothetical protein